MRLSAFILIVMAVFATACRAAEAGPLAVSTSEPTQAPTPERCPVDAVTTVPELPGIMGVKGSATDSFDPDRIQPWDVVDVSQELKSKPQNQLSGGPRVPTDAPGDGPVTLGVLISNNHDGPVTFELEGDPAYDFAVFDSQGNEVWRLSEDGTDVPGPMSVPLRSYEEMTLEAQWDLTGKDRKRVDDGLYWVYPMVSLETPYVKTYGASQIYVGRRPTLDEALELRLTAPEQIRCGESVPMTLEVTNVTDQPVYIGTGVDFDDYTASIPGQGQIWRYWADKARILPLIHSELAPGETWTFRRTWPLYAQTGEMVVIDREMVWPRENVRPGVYELQASVSGFQAENSLYGTETALSNVVTVTVAP